MALVEQEVREENQTPTTFEKKRPFPTAKMLELFDFHLIPSLNMPKVSAMAKGEFVETHENMILIAGTPANES